MNIWSGSSDRLGAALTNPTELAVRKGKLNHPYPIAYADRIWPDLEAAYQALKLGKEEFDNSLMVRLMFLKLLQYPALVDDLTTRGGIAYLETCEHQTGARSARFKRWEGKGRESRFIRNLIAAYAMALEPETVLPLMEHHQP